MDISWFMHALPGAGVISCINIDVCWPLEQRVIYHCQTYGRNQSDGRKKIIFKITQSSQKIFQARQHGRVVSLYKVNMIIYYRNDKIGQPEPNPGQFYLTHYQNVYIGYVTNIYRCHSKTRQTFYSFCKYPHYRSFFCVTHLVDTLLVLALWMKFPIRF